MPLRKVLLRAMLWSLGVAAAAGILAALTGGNDTVWRVVGTGFVTAFACGLMMPFSSMLDREKTRTVGLSGIGVVLLEFFLALALIWELARRVFGLRWEDEIGLTMLCFGLASALFGLSVALAHQPHGRLSGRVGMGATAVTFIAFLLAIWGPSRILDKEKWLESGAAVFTIGLLVLLSLISAGTVTGRRWRWVAPPAAILAFALWMSHVWLETQSPLGTVMFAVLVSVAAVVAHANLCLLVPLTGGQGWLRIGAIAAGLVTAVAVDLIVLNEAYVTIRWDNDTLGRITGAAAISAACGSMALLVLALINRGAYKQIPAAELGAMSVTCPRCRKRQSIALGGSSCVRCGLHISIRVEEPA